MVANKLAWKETPGEHNDAIYNLGSHLIDQAIVLFGKPHKVTCRSWPQRGVEGLDDSVRSVGMALDDSTDKAQFEMTLHYPPQPNSNGPLFVTLSASILSPQKPQIRYILQGETGSYIKHNLDPQENYLKVGGQSRGDEYGEEIEAAWGVIQTVKEEGSDVMTEPTK
jgi:scyllo-inositol 2-dehydrogenase (NADP+)